MRQRVVGWLLAAALTLAAVAAVAAAVRIARPADAPAAAATPSAMPSSATEPSPSPTAEPPPTGLHGGPWGSVTGLTMFRGNPTRNWYGTGPIAAGYAVAWQFPTTGRLCSDEVLPQPSPTASDAAPPPPQVKRWCGSGWTGQPAVWVRPDGVTEVIVGAYDRAVHFLDGHTGTETRPPFVTGDIIKGSVTLDPDGFPLLYTGSRDNRYRVIALDRDVPTELFALEPSPRGLWNNDWDGNGVIIDGLLLEGGEDSWFRVVELNRGYDADGLVQVAPEILAEIPGWDDELLRDLRDRNVSIETSVAVVDGVVYFANSGGLVQGYDLSRVRAGELPQVLRYWVGDDTDATIVADADGYLYVAVEYERRTARSREVGQLVKLDPRRPDDPRVWGVEVPPRSVGGDGNGGIWATPAVYGDYVYVTTHPGDLLVVDRASGEVVFSERTGYHEWSSPVIVDDTLIVGLCDQGGLRGYSLADPAAPRQVWEVSVPTRGCVESTPAVWDGRIYVGSRDGHIYSFEAG